MLFSSNQDDLDRRHLWRVDVAGGKPAALTKGNGIEWLPVMTSDGKALAYLRLGSAQGGAAGDRDDQARGGAARELVPGSIPADFPESALVEPEQVIFTPRTV